MVLIFSMFNILSSNTRSKAYCFSKFINDRNQLIYFSNKGNGNSNNDSEKPVFNPEEVSIDNPPTTCCMSGCSNCVYIAWAEALAKKMSSADPIIAKKILEQVDDPNMKAFLKMELRNKGLLKE